MKIEFEIKDIYRDEVIDAMADSLLHRWSDDDDESPTDLGRSLGHAVKAKIEEVAKELVRQHFDTVIHERIAAAVDAVIADGWYETDGYGGRKGEKMDLRARVSKAMTEPRRDSGGYNNKPSLIAERIDEAAKGFLDKELRAEVEKAKATLRAKLDASVMETVANTVKTAIGLGVPSRRDEVQRIGRRPLPRDRRHRRPRGCGAGVGVVTTVEQQLRAELAAARATIASLQRQLALRVEAFTFAVVCVAPAAESARFDEPTTRRRPAIIRREPRTKVIDVPCVEVRP